MNFDNKHLEKTRKYKERHVNVYKNLFSVDFVSDPNHFLIETPFTFIDWRQIE